MGTTNFDVVQANLYLGGTFPSFGYGNVYYVCQAANTIPYRDLSLKFGGQTYSDGSQILHTTIAAALTATVANRNDYVIVVPDSSDYDVTATLTMDKARTHLMAPAGIGWGGITGNSVRIHMNTAATDTITVSADNTEIAGFFFKHDASSTSGNTITYSGTRWCANVHDNFFGMYATAATNNYGIYAAGAMNHYAIYNNYFTNYSPGLNTGSNNTILAFIGITSGSSTRGVIRNNIMLTGVNTTVAAAINDAGTGTVIMDNLLYENTANGGNDAGILTLGISTGTDALVVRNLIGMATANAANAVSGGSANTSYILNYEGTSGGTLAV
jgi:hypothetical protein